MMPGLYIHIPFCLSKCAYCDFYSVTQTEKMPPFIRSLRQEMSLYRGLFDPFDTIYLGGGTPSLLGIDQIETILNAIYATFTIADDAEITCEANPGDLTPEVSRALRSAGINRLTIGVQSFDNGVLTFLGRRHDTAGATAAIENARKAGFENIGLDLIYGVPGQELRSWLETLKSALSFSPEHLSCYQLTLEPSTPLGEKYRSGAVALPDDDLLYEFFMETSRTLEEAGYIHYEVSNFARGTEWTSRHNSKYWNHTPYLGLGPAAHSFSGTRRWWNCRSLDRYIEIADRGIPPIGGSELLTREQLRLERLYLGLRTREGIDLEDFAKRHGCDLLQRKDRVLPQLIEDGLLEISTNHLRPTLRGLAVSDSLPLFGEK